MTPTKTNTQNNTKTRSSNTKRNRQSEKMCVFRIFILYFIYLKQTIINLIKHFIQLTIHTVTLKN